MYIAHFLEHPDCSENLYENTKDFTRKVLIRYFDLLCCLRDEQLDKNEVLPIIDMMNPVQGEC